MPVYQFTVTGGPTYPDTRGVLPTLKLLSMVSTGCSWERLVLSQKAGDSPFWWRGIWKEVSLLCLLRSRILKLLGKRQQTLWSSVPWGRVEAKSHVRLEGGQHIFVLISVFRQRFTVSEGSKSRNKSHLPLGRSRETLLGLNTAPIASRGLRVLRRKQEPLWTREPIRAIQLVSLSGHRAG